MTREVKNGKVTFKGGQCGRMDHHVWQVVPGINNTVREKVFGGINILELCLQRSHRSEAISSATREAGGL